MDVIKDLLAGSTVTLQPHSSASARDQAVCFQKCPSGSLLFSTTALSSALLPSDKGKRCDHCHFIPPKGSSPLKRCSGCASYYYCSPACQRIQWNDHHQSVCRKYSRFTVSPEYQALSSHERMDALLLSHTVCRMHNTQGVSSQQRDSGPDIFMTLLPSPSPSETPPVITTTTSIHQSHINRIYARFGNNNFAIHSHLNTYAHGVFPLASRVFNHSCYPNAAPRYVIRQGLAIEMEVVALRDIEEGEEICIPYIDPALPMPLREKMLDMTYGFRCLCTLCEIVRSLEPIPEPPSDPIERERLDNILGRLVFRDDSGLIGPNRTLQISEVYRSGSMFANFPAELKSVFHESYVPSLSEPFSKACHEGTAVPFRDGETLLALYALLYPPNYPQIGMHVLELAKTTWNAIVTDGALTKNDVQSYMLYAKNCIGLAASILNVYGTEGDEGGPLEEIHVLTNLLDST